MSKTSDQRDSNQEAIAASEELLRALVTATSDVIYSMNADWSVMRELDGRGFVNDTNEPRADWKALNVYADDIAKVDAVIAEAIREKKIFQMEHRVNRADGTTGWTFSRAVPILDEQGEILEWFGTASDITERKLFEKALQETRDQSEHQRRVYETIISNTPDLMYVFDLNYRFTYANQALLEMWGKTWETAIGKNLLENGYEPWHAEMHEREIDRIIVNKQPIRGEVSFPHATLGRRVYDYILTPVMNDAGEVIAVAGTTRDVTERKHSEEAIAQSSEELQVINEELEAANNEHSAINEELSAANDELRVVNQRLIEANHKLEEAETALRLAISAANFGTWYIHSETREFVTDARLKELFGYYSHEDLSIEQALAQITDEYRGFVSEKLENAIHGNGDYDVTYSVVGLHDQQLRWLRAIGNLKADPSGAFSAFTGVVMDITEQHLAAEKVARTEERLRIAIDAAGLATFSVHTTDRTLITSPRLKEFFGFNNDEELPFRAAIDQIHVDFREKVAEKLEAAFTTGARFDMEYPIIGHHDQKVRWVRGIGEIHRIDGKEYFTGVLHETTEKKLDELRKNDFIGMVSHELKTPLTSLTAIIQVANAKLKKSDDQFLAGAMTKANIQAKRMSTMINGFLNISRLESGKILIEKTHFDIRGLVREVAEETEISIASHKINLDLCDPVNVLADRDKISSVVTNMLSNAVKYSPAGTTISIACKMGENEVVVSVQDEGVGINSMDAEKIFDRYYRIQNSNTSLVSGFGIGLYLSAEIVERHGGKIWLESEPGKGSTFYFSLPSETTI